MSHSTRHLQGINVSEFMLTFVFLLSFLVAITGPGVTVDPIYSPLLHFGGSSGIVRSVMAEEATLAVRALIFSGDLDLLKGLLQEHNIEVEDIEATTKTQAVTLVDAWFLEQLKDKDKGISAMHSIMETLERKPLVDLKTTSTPSFRKDCKISGQIDSKSGISYTSLRRQFENAKAKGYKEIDIIDAILKAIPPTSGLRGYLEGKDSLNLESAIKILRAHYNERSATELYNELGQLTQHTKETSSDFLMRALELKQKVIYASNEGSEEMKYSIELVQNLFVRTVSTGLSNVPIRQEFKLYLERKDISDEELIDNLNKIVSRETERQTKFNKVKVHELREDTDKSELRGMRTEIAELRQAVEQLTAKSSFSEAGKPKVSTYKRCQQCKENNSTKCIHCWKCGSEEHFSRGCRKGRQSSNSTGHQGNFHRPHQGGKM